jgi:hypothetical protein
VNLMLNLLFFSPLTDGTQVWSEISAAAIHAVAMLTSLLMKERGSGLLAVARIGVNDRSGRLGQATCKRYGNGHERRGDEDSCGDFAVC